MIELDKLSKQEKSELLSQDEVVTWFRKAAEQDYAEAQYELGVCYYFGWGVMQNESEALYWYRKAAAQDHAYAKEWVQCLENEGYSGHQKIKKCLYWWQTKGCEK